MNGYYSTEMEEPIYHILSASEWFRACQMGSYEPESIQKEGFIHFSTKKQIRQTLKKWYPHRDDLFIIEVYQNKVSVDLRFEGEERFPHLYRPLDTAEINRVFPLPLLDQGEHQVPCLTGEICGNPLVLFDIDSTLLKGSSAHREAFRFAFDELFGIKSGLDSIQTLHGRTDPDLINEALIEAGVPDRELEEVGDGVLNAVIRHYYRLSCDDNPRRLSGAIQLLSDLRSKGYCLGLVTGNLEPIGWGKLRQVDIDHFFSFGAFSSDRPNRCAMVKLAIQRYRKLVQSGDQRIFLVGDAIQDMEAAKNNGILGIGVSTGIYDSQTLFKSGATLAVSDLDELFEKREGFLYNMN